MDSAENWKTITFKKFGKLRVNTVLDFGETSSELACTNISEWKKGSIPVTLQDDDTSTQRWEGWKKINTLQHYRVVDGAECALVRRYQTIKSPNGSLDTSVVSVNSSMPILRSESDTGTKFFHLVRVIIVLQIIVGRENFLQRSQVLYGTDFINI